jgi:hypothetical protein
MGDGAHYQVKGSVFRAHLKWLERERLLELVAAKVSPESARLFKSPPLGSSWMESAPLDELMEQIEVVRGLDGVRQVARDTLRDEMSPMLGPMVRGVMRVIGGSPPTLYSRMGDLVRTILKDVEYRWTSTGDKKGTLDVSYPNGHNVPMRTFVSGVMGVEHMLTLCNAVGTVADPVRRSHNAAYFAIDWK